MDESPDLKALRASSSNMKLYLQDEINADLLECFDNPAKHDGQATPLLWEKISVPEFTCLCPITGQPDFAQIDIYYRPAKKCVESKALKLYLGSFRNVGTFHEAATNRICEDLTRLLSPVWLLVIGRYTPRGGIPFQPRVWHGNVPTELLYRE